MDPDDAIRRMSDQPALDPGSPEAVALGCLCCQDWADTKFGREFLFTIDRACALHDCGAAWWQCHYEESARYGHLRREVDSAADIEQLPAP
jgi:hypothetical protein